MFLNRTEHWILEQLWLKPIDSMGLLGPLMMPKVTVDTVYLKCSQDVSSQASPGCLNMLSFLWALSNTTRHHGAFRQSVDYSLQTNWVNWTSKNVPYTASFAVQTPLQSILPVNNKHVLHTTNTTILVRQNLMELRRIEHTTPYISVMFICSPIQPSYAIDTLYIRTDRSTFSFQCSIIWRFLSFYSCK